MPNTRSKQVNGNRYKNNFLAEYMGEKTRLNNNYFLNKFTTEKEARQQIPIIMF